MNTKEYSLGLYEKAMPSGMTFFEMLENAKNAGFDRFEISVDETEDRLARLDWPKESRSGLRAAAVNTGVRIDTMCLSGHRKYPLGSHDENVRARSLEIMEKAIEFCSDTGIRIIQLAGYDVYYETGDELTRSYFLENLHRSVEMAAAAGVLLGFETMETAFMDTVEKATRYVKSVNSPYLGVYPDIGNLKNASIVYGTDVLEDLETGTGHFFAAHLKETVPGIYRDRTFGDGHTEYVPCIRSLWRLGVRMFTGEFWYLGEPDYQDTLRNAACFLRDKIEKASTETE